jgi:hypothetical protein
LQKWIIKSEKYENLGIYFYQDKIEINDSIAIKAIDEYYENRNDIPFTVSFAKTVAVIDRFT